MEIKRQPQDRPDPQTRPEADDFDPDALAAIRTLLEVETEEASQPEPVKETMAKPVAPMPEPQAAAAPETGPTQDGAPSRLDEIKAAVTGYRPTRRHIILASLALVLVFRPWLVFWTTVFCVFVLIGVFLILGYDGFWRRAMGLGRWYAKRRPARAAELHRKLDAFAMKWDAVLDRFPEGSVDGLYLPDFGEMATSEQRHDDALDRRFANMRENEA